MMYYMLYVLRDCSKTDYVKHNMQHIVINFMPTPNFSTKPMTERRILQSSHQCPDQNDF